MKATVTLINEEYFFQFDDKCPFNVGDELECVIEGDKVFLRVVQPDLFPEQ